MQTQNLKSLSSSVLPLSFCDFVFFLLSIKNENSQKILPLLLEFMPVSWKIQRFEDLDFVVVLKRKEGKKIGKGGEGVKR